MREAAVLAVVLSAYFMVLLDNSIIFTGLPSIRESLELSPAELSWTQNAYTLVFGGLLLLSARAGDIWGRRRLFMVGVAIFSVASLLVGLAPNGPVMIGARGVQGVGSSIVAPTCLALLTAHFAAGHARNRAVAWYAAMAGIGVSFGLVLGGAVADLMSWRVGFLINVPVGIAVILIARRELQESECSSGRFDVAGAVLATVGAASLVFGIVNAADNKWTSPETLVSLVVALATLSLLVWNEARATQPIMPLRLFASAERSGAYVTRLLYIGAMFGFFYFTTQYLQDVLGWSPLEAGLGFLPMTGVSFFVALAVPSLVLRRGNAPVLLAGVVLTATGMAWLSRLEPGDAYLVAIGAPMVLIGAGQGLAFAPLTSAGIVDVPTEDSGAAAGMVNTAHQLGSALGLSVLVALSLSAGSGDSPTAVAGRVSEALSGCNVFVGLATVVSVFVLIPRELSRRRQAPPKHRRSTHEQMESETV